MKIFFVNHKLKQKALEGDFLTPKIPIEEIQLIEILDARHKFRDEEGNVYLMDLEEGLTLNQWYSISG